MGGSISVDEAAEYSGMVGWFEYLNTSEGHNLYELLCKMGSEGRECSKSKHVSYLSSFYRGVAKAYGEYNYNKTRLSSNKEEDYERIDRYRIYDSLDSDLRTENYSIKDIAKFKKKVGYDKENDQSKVIYSMFVEVAERKQLLLEKSKGWRRIFR